MLKTHLKTSDQTSKITIYNKPLDKMRKACKSNIFGRKYFESTGLISDQATKILAKSLSQEFNPKAVLDIGCAMGSLVQAFRRIGVDAYGVDISQYALSKATPDISPFLYRVDAGKEPLPFRDNFFDIITVLGTIEYVTDCDYLIQQVRRTLKQNALVFLYTRNKRFDGLETNLFDQSTWIKKFKEFDFIYDEEFSKWFKKQFLLSSLLPLSRRTLVKCALKMRRIPYSILRRREFRVYIWLVFRLCAN